MEYIRQDADKAYRKIKMTDSIVPTYIQFSDPGQRITVLENEVLEVEKHDGTTQLIKGTAAKTVIVYRKTFPPADTGFSISSRVPTARLWVCSTQGGKTKYKVPQNLPFDSTGNSKLFTIPDISNAELCGDKYFEALYELQRQ